jgi:hypothetical protein
LSNYNFFLKGKKIELERDLHEAKSAQTSAPKTALAGAFLYKFIIRYLINGLASAVFGAAVCADFTSCKWPFIVGLTFFKSYLQNLVRL